MEIVKLKNGAEEAKPLVAVIMMSLENLITTNPIGFYEVVMKARNGNHKIWGNMGEGLVQSGLLQEDQSMHDSVRNIVLSAVTGNDLDMTLVSPVASQQASAPAAPTPRP